MTIALVVEILNVLDPSPPVPHVSKELLKPLIIFAFFLMLFIAPKISSTLSFFSDKDVRNSIIFFSSIFCNKI